MYLVVTVSWWFEQARVVDVPLFSMVPGASNRASGDLAFVKNHP
jgi:hypothetical protein